MSPMGSAPPPLPLSLIVNLSMDVSNKLRIYQDHFEKKYISCAIGFMDRAISLRMVFRIT